jgi:extradiol dioxygenase family protein
MLPFHVTFPLRDLTEVRHFFGELLGYSEGRSSEDWVDFNFYEHQIIAYLSPDMCGETATSAVDHHQVPVHHFGAVLSIPAWETLAQSLKAAGTKLIIEPCIRFKGAAGEQACIFLRDPSGNAIKIKAFKDMASLYAK